MQTGTTLARRIGTGPHSRSVSDTPTRGVVAAGAEVIA